MLGVESIVLRMLGKCSTTELYSQTSQNAPGCIHFFKIQNSAFPHLHPPQCLQIRIHKSVSVHSVWLILWYMQISCKGASAEIERHGGLYIK
jgi:hypothetical protein